MIKHYCVPARTDVEGSGLPEMVTFDIERDTAGEIVRLAELARANGLHKVEKFDYRASFLLRTPEEDAELSEGGGAHPNRVSMDGDRLIVSPREFWFSAYIKHSTEEILSRRCSVDELARHFGLPQGGA